MIPESAGFTNVCAGGGFTTSESAVPKVAAIINWYGITDVADLLAGSNSKSYAVQWLGSLPNREAVARSVSPITYVRSGLPPILSIQGDADPIVPYSQNVRLRDALTKAGVTRRTRHHPRRRPRQFQARRAHQDLPEDSRVPDQERTRRRLSEHDGRADDGAVGHILESLLGLIQRVSVAGNRLGVERALLDQAIRRAPARAPIRRLLLHRKVHKKLSPQQGAAAPRRDRSQWHSLTSMQAIYPSRYRIEGEDTIMYISDLVAAAVAAALVLGVSRSARSLRRPPHRTRTSRPVAARFARTTAY